MFNELTEIEYICCNGGSQILDKTEVKVGITLDLNKVIDSVGNMFNNIGKALHRAFGCPHCW